MNFEEALANFLSHVEIEYGERDWLVKIEIDPTLMNKIVLDFYKHGGLIRPTPKQFGECELLGVKLLATRRDNF